jgi:hypothetical protein
MYIEGADMQASRHGGLAFAGYPRAVRPAPLLLLADFPAPVPADGPLPTRLAHSGNGPGGPFTGRSAGPGDSCGDLLQHSRAGRPLEEHDAAGSGIERRVQTDQVNKGIANLLAQNRQVVAAMQMVDHRRVVPLVATGPRHARGMVAKSLTRAVVRDDRRAGQPAIGMVSLGCGKARG